MNTFFGFRGAGVLGFSGLLVLGLAAQGAPSTEVYLVTLERGAARPVHGPVVNISNSPGYDNQPSFTPDGRFVLFTSERQSAPTDIYRYEIATAALVQLTHTAEKEYSPLVTPDGKTFTVIQVEANNDQRLWRFDPDGTNARVVLPDVKPVGYHVWADATHLALFVLGAQGQPATLQWADTTTGKAEVIEAGIGRSLGIRPGTGLITFVSKPRTGPWVIKSFDPKTRAVAAITETVERSEDYAWDPVTRDLYMARGTKVFVWRATAAGWQDAGDLAGEGIGNITRMAISPDRGSATTPGRLALVAEPASK